MGRESLSPADPQARTMKTRNGFMPAYNVQSTVDDDSHFMMTCEVTDSPIDIELLAPNMTALKEQLDIVPEMVRADCGYANEEQIQLLEQQGIECIVPFQDEPAVKKTERENGITFYDYPHDVRFKKNYYFKK
jgi:hypothetical protein